MLLDGKTPPQRGDVCGFTPFKRNYLQPQPQPQPPLVRQERRRMSHTRSQELQPPKPVFVPQPKQLRSIISNTISQVLQPEPFVPFVKKPFILCTSCFIGFYSYITLRNRSNLCYSSFTRTRANIIWCELFEANDRLGCGLVLHIGGVGVVLDMFQYGLKVVDFA